MSEDSASDTSDLPPPWEQPVEVDNMAEVKYQGPVTIHTMVDPVPGPSFEDQANAMPKRDKIIQICQSDEMFTWVHALATILVINEKAVLGGLKVSEQLKVWQDPEKSALDFCAAESVQDDREHYMGRSHDSSPCNGDRRTPHHCHW